MKNILISEQSCEAAADAYRQIKAYARRSGIPSTYYIVIPNDLGQEDFLMFLGANEKPSDVEFIPHKGAFQLVTGEQE